MAGETHDKTQPVAKEETRKTDQNISQDLKKLQIQFQDAFRRYRDIIGRAVCDDHDRRITNIQILLINKEIKEINNKQRSLFKRWRRTREARRMLIRLSRQRRLESDIDERFNFHYSARFRRHWEMALDRMQVNDKDETLRLKSWALLDILPKSLDKELRQIEKDEPPLPSRTDLMKALGLDKTNQNGRKRGASRRGGGSAGGSGEEGRAFKAPRCSKRIRGVSPSMDAEESGATSAVCNSLSVNGAARPDHSLTSADSNGTDSVGRMNSSTGAAEKVNDEAGSDPTSPSSTQRLSSVSQQQQQQQPVSSTPADRKTQSLDSRGGGEGGSERRSFCCAYCQSIRRISASMWRTDGVLWCRHCRRFSGASSAVESNTEKLALTCERSRRGAISPAAAASSICPSSVGYSGTIVHTNGGDDPSVLSSSSTNSTAALC